MSKRNSGCTTCPLVNECFTLYRGSACVAKRQKIGLGDPQTVFDVVTSSPEALATFLADVLSAYDHKHLEMLSALGIEFTYTSIPAAEVEYQLRGLLKPMSDTHN